MKRNKEIGILVLRLAIGLLMLFHGIAKFTGVSGIENMLTNYGLPSFLAYGVYITEVIAPILMIVGYRTRLASLVYIFGVLVAIFLAHSQDVFTFNQYGGWGIELLGLYLFGALSIFFTGAGKYSISQKSKWD